MAIVKMKKLQLMVVRQQKDELLRDLMLLGCVEVTDPDAFFADEETASVLHHESGNLVEARSDQARLIGALKLLDKYAPVKTKLLSPRPAVSEAQFLDDTALREQLAAAQELEEMEAQIRRLSGEESKLRSTVETLRPWAALELPLDTSGTASTAILLGTFPAATDLNEVRRALEDAAPEAELFPVSSDKEQHYMVLVCLKEEQAEALAALRTFGYAFANVSGMTGTAKENIDTCIAEIAALTKQRAEVEAAIVTYGTHRDAFKLSIDRIASEVSKAEAEERFVGTDSVVCMRGWLTAPEEEKLAQTLAKYDCSWELEDPVEEEYPDVPIKLKNNKVNDSLNMVTEMYSLPIYGGLDPNPLMAPFFIFFYGLMMADVGYGLLMVIASFVVLQKARPKGTTHHMFSLLRYGGYVTIVFGLLTGSFFGDLIPQLVSLTTGKEFAFPSLFSPLNDALAVLLGSLALGLIQIFTGMGISMYKQIKRGETMAALCNEGAWYVVFICIGIAAVTGAWGPCMIAAVVVLVLTQGYGKKGIGGKLIGIGGSLYNNITGYFSDILSYSRLMALMLAGAVIAQVFNTLGAITGNVITFFIISAIGNALNFALNLLSCYVHDLRLQCLEYFGRFYEDGGKPFDPVEIKTNYVEVIQ